MTTDQLTTDQRIVGLGEVLWDVFPTGAVFGGAPANFACHVAALGGQSCMLSAVGDDALGHEALATLRARGVDPDLVQVDPLHPTGTVQVAIDSAGVASYVFAADTAWDRIRWDKSVWILSKSCAAVCFGTLGQRSATSRQTIERFVLGTRAETLRVFDVNLRQDFYSAEIIQESLWIANALKLNAEELPVVADACGIRTTTSVGMLEAIQQRYDLRLTVLTLGAEGSFVMADGETSEQPATAVDVVDTVGAGDAFTAALVMGMLHGLPLDVIHRHAAGLAAFVCTRRGATPEIPAALRAPPGIEPVG